MKKLFKILGGLFALLIIAIIAAPFFLDADKFRPQIIQVVEDNLNADLELGKLKLSFWGGLHLGIEKLTLSEKGTGGKKVIFAMKDARLEVPIASVFSKRPDITLSVNRPEINIIKGEDGKLNVTKLTKPSAPGKATDNQGAQKAGAAAGGGLAVAFDLSFRIREGQLLFSDEKAKTKTTINGFNFTLRKFTLNDWFSFSFDSKLDVQQMKDLILRGPLELSGRSKLQMGLSGFEKAELETDLDLSSLHIKYGSLMNKNEKVPLKVELKLWASAAEFFLEKCHLQLGSAAVDTKGKVNNFGAPVIDFKIESTKFVFDEWRQVLAPLNEFEMSGAASFKISASGPVSKLGFNGEAKLENAGLKAPGIVPRVTDLGATLTFSNDQAAIKNAGLKMGSSDIEMEGFVKNFSSPIIDVSVKSANMDLDSLLPQAPAKGASAVAANGAPAGKEPSKPDAPNSKAGAPAGAAAPGAVDPEAAIAGPIAALKSNPIARKLDFTGRLSMKKLTMHKAELSNLAAVLTFKDLVMNLTKASANAFAGSMNFTTSIDFRGNDPAYNVSGDVSGVDINAAVTNQMPTLKDSIQGKIVGGFKVSGTGVSKAKTKDTMKGDGKFKIANGSWNAFAALKMIGERVKSFPALQTKLGGVVITDRFRELRTDFNISGGRFNILNMTADLESANTGVTGTGFVDFDMNMQLAGKLLLPISNPPARVKTADGRLGAPYKLDCPITEVGVKCFKTEETLNPLVLAYGEAEAKKQISKAIEENQEVKKAIEKAPPQVKEKVDDVKKLFGL